MDLKYTTIISGTDLSTIQTNTTATTINAPNTIVSLAKTIKTTRTKFVQKIKNLFLLKFDR